MTEAMTPRGMVTDAQCEEWRKHYTELEKDGGRVAPPIVLALLADRERWKVLAELANKAKLHHTSPWAQELGRLAAKLLKGVGRGE